MTDPYATTQPNDPNNQAATGSAQPSASATKAELVEHAVSQGMDRNEAEAATKDDLKTRLGVQ